MSQKILLKAIKLKCLDCCGGSAQEVKLCEVAECPLWIYRFGKNPNPKRRGNPGLIAFNQKKAKEDQK